MYQRKKIGEILVELGVLTETDVDKVLQAQRRRPDAAKFGQIAKDMGLCREEHILAALAVQMELFPETNDLDRILGRLQRPVRTPLPVPRLRAQDGRKR